MIFTKKLAYQGSLTEAARKLLRRYYRCPLSKNPLSVGMPLNGAAILLAHVQYLILFIAQRAFRSNINFV